MKTTKSEYFLRMTIGVPVVGWQVRPPSERIDLPFNSKEEALGALIAIKQAFRMKETPLVKNVSKHRLFEDSYILSVEDRIFLRVTAEMEIAVEEESWE